jgi:hypothetical protein
MTTPVYPGAEWEEWQARVRDELSDLGAGEAVTVTIRPQAPAISRRGPRWRPRRAAKAATTAPEVFIQARIVAGQLAVECIGDTEWEGVTTLTAGQQQGLSALGWEREGADPTFSRTYDQEATPDGEAATLLVRSLRDVLGAASPTDVELRRTRSQT